MTLTFEALRAANQARLPQFRNRKGQIAHPQGDGSDWCLAQWCNAVTGELGELANLIKKIERGDQTLDESRQAVAHELADVATYLDILAFRAGVDLGAAIVEKFNIVSERVGATTRIAAPAGLADVLAAIARERTRQLTELGYDATHDDEHVDGELANAAACYAAGTAMACIDVGPACGNDLAVPLWPRGWDWPAEWTWQPAPPPSWRAETPVAPPNRQACAYRRRQLIIAAALIVAEIERLDRDAKTNTVAGDRAS